MPPMNQGKTGRSYWRSLDELAETTAFREMVEKEFPSFAPELLHSASRRQFLKVMGASLALAGMTGCRWPKETIVPHARRPRGRTPGVPVEYATAFELGGVATGVLVTSFDGRPVKIEGNKEHAYSLGASSALAQAAILELYDPDRSQHVARRGGEGEGASNWAEFTRFASEHFSKLRGKQGEGLCVLSEATDSPSVADMRDRLLSALPKARWFEYEPVSYDNERAGVALVNGSPQRRHCRLADGDRITADVIVCFDSDLLMTHPTAVRNAREFSRGRVARDGQMNRLYVVESDYSITGGVADYRFPVRSCEIPAVLCALASDLIGRGLELGPAAAAVRAALEGFTPAVATDFVKQIAKDLMDHKGKVLIDVGPSQAPEVHALAHLLNQALGGPFTYTADPRPERPSHAESIAALAELMGEKVVDTLLILGGNPVYDAPADLDFAGKLGSVTTSVHLSLYNDETSRRCNWHLPRAHFLESWGDARAYDGTVSIVQPLIAPLYGGRSPIEVLALAIGDELTDGHKIVQRTFRAAFAAAGDFEKQWNRALFSGVVADSAWPAASGQAAEHAWLGGLVESAAKIEPRATGEYELVFRPDHKVHDGRFANNGWLQELPDPITKITWDNAALISPTDARQLGVRYGDLLRITHDGRTLDMPAYVLPGHATGSITLPLGYGRTQAGYVAAGDDGNGAGSDTYRLRSSAAMYIATGATLVSTGGKTLLAVTQDHHAIRSEVGDEATRERIEELYHEITLDEYKAGHQAVELPQFNPLWKEHSYEEGHRWGMAIDLSKCTGCSACVVACQAENNIPVVGKAEVERGREMHWIRIDRYFAGSPEQARIVQQPVTCQHCENAPCEQVCPVGATVHSAEGLNDQIYNRCIGTRYCLNNCPYKVRRFNWFFNHHGPEHPRSIALGESFYIGTPDHKELNDIEKMAFNPEVTVRARGVMEKCTFCIQRISAARIVAKNEGVEIEDGSFTTACAQACPSEAIVFGDLNDKNARVRKAHADSRAYALLRELNVKPRNLYLARLRNTAPHAGAASGHELTRASDGRTRAG